MEGTKMHQLLESLKTCRNLCDTALLLVSLEKDSLLPTILETLHVETQDMIDDYCGYSLCCRYGWCGWAEPSQDRIHKHKRRAEWDDFISGDLSNANQAN